ATYQINAPAGGWQVANSGSYSLAVQGGQVLDTSGNAAAAQSLGSVSVTATPVDSSGPTVASVNLPALTTAMSSYSFSVTYADNVAVKISSFGGFNVLVSGPNGYRQFASFVSTDATTDGTPRTASYRLAGPGGGSWSASANGQYEFDLLSTQ